MSDMAKWDDYLVEYCQNAEQDGATPCDLLELLMVQAGRVLPRIKAEEVHWADLTQYARQPEAKRN
jgi:hypothetical protein